ncbi:hypothetical protein [Paraburkholderia terrae]
MERIPNRKYPATFSLVRPRSGNSSVSDDFRLRKQVDELCIALFDRWCERRELTPLLYLLHAWPFFPSTPEPIKAISAALGDLSRFHREALDIRERELIARVFALAGD